MRSKQINNLLRKENHHLSGENIQNKNDLTIEKTNNANNIKKINRLKHHINKNTDINSTTNIIDVSIDEDINLRRNNGNDKPFIDDFVAFKKFATLEFQNINQQIANLNMKDQYPQGKTLNEQQEEWKERSK